MNPVRKAFFRVSAVLIVMTAYSMSVVAAEKSDSLATSLHDQAEAFTMQRKYAEAEPLFKRSLEILEKERGSNHPDVAESLNNLALFYDMQGKNGQAEPLFKRALQIWEKAPSSSQTDLAVCLNNLATHYQQQGKYAEAEPLFKRSLAIREKVPGQNHQDVAQSLSSLAILYNVQGKYEQAVPLFKRALQIQEKVPGQPGAVAWLKDYGEIYAGVLRRTKQDGEADKVEARAKAVRTAHSSSKSENH